MSFDAGGGATGDAGASLGGGSRLVLGALVAAAAGFCVVLPVAPAVVGVADFGAGATGAVTGGGVTVGAGALAFGVGSTGAVGVVADAVAASMGGVAGGGVAAAV